MNGKIQRSNSNLRAAGGGEKKRKGVDGQLMYFYENPDTQR